MGCGPRDVVSGDVPLKSWMSGSGRWKGAKRMEARLGASGGMGVDLEMMGVVGLQGWDTKRCWL